MIQLRSYQVFLFVLFLSMNFHAQASIGKDLSYSVYLDGDKIGYHQVNVEQQAGRKIVQTQARFNVKVFFINAYDYQHSALETWKDGCLESIRSQTDDNGEKISLIGREQQSLFILETPEGSASFEGCVRSFAYWDLDLLKTSRLLNSQTGQYTAVNFVEVGIEQIELGAKRMEATQYRIISEKFTIDLWYSRDKEWLALTTETENGSVLRYERD